MAKLRTSALFAVSALCLAMAPRAQALVGDDDKLSISAHILETTPLKPGPDFVKSLHVAQGYRINVFAKDLGNARFIVMGPNGDVYVQRNEQADVIRLRDANHDGVADGPPVVVAQRAGLLGMALHDGQVYLATAGELYKGELKADGTFGPLTRLFKDLPSSGQHHTRHMEFGPDGKLYLGIGSTCNTCTESSQESGTVLKVEPDGKSRSVFASGLRHTIGFDWHPKTGELWGWDQGIDWMGDDLQREELNKLEAGQRYGWPYVMEDGKAYPQLEPPGDVSNAQWAAASRNPVLMHVAHSAGMQLRFHPGGGVMGTEVANDAFVTLRGSWNRKPASGYEVDRIRFDAKGQPTRIEPFVTGFLAADGLSNYGRLVGLAIAPDGALLFGDDTNGIIYRVVKDGAQGAYTPPKPPAGPMLAQAARGTHVPLAIARPQTQPKGAAALRVSSPAFHANGAIPPTYTEWGDKVSLPLRWAAVSGAKSYAVVMEDPDGPQKPTVHWVAWNIPGGVTALPQGLPAQERLVGLGLTGMMQGTVSGGMVGYKGPRPPIGDRPHHYHVQLLALDKLLEAPLGASRDQLLAAAQGHVLARGELMGTYRQASPPVD